MTEGEKNYLLKDLCARLPYGVKGLVTFHISQNEDVIDDEPRIITPDLFDRFMRPQNSWYSNIPCIKPYLRPMSSMSFDECFELERVRDKYENHYDVISAETDWLNVNHFDYRDLIPYGLALPAKEGMYKI